MGFYLRTFFDAGPELTAGGILISVVFNMGFSLSVPLLHPFRLEEMWSRNLPICLSVSCDNGNFTFTRGGWHDSHPYWNDSAALLAIPFFGFSYLISVFRCWFFSVVFLLAGQFLNSDWYSFAMVWERKV